MMSRMSTGSLTDRDRRFADLLVETGGNASAAAREVGLSPSRGRELRQKPAIKKYVDMRLDELHEARTEQLVLTRQFVEEKTLELYDAAIRKGSLVAAANSLTLAERLTREEAKVLDRAQLWVNLIQDAVKEIESLPPDEKLEFVARNALFDLGITQICGMAPSVRLLEYLRKRIDS